MKIGTYKTIPIQNYSFYWVRIFYGKKSMFQKMGLLATHSSQFKGLCLTKSSSEMLQNAPAKCFKMTSINIKHVTPESQGLLIENEIGINCSKHSQCWHCQKGWGIAQILVTKTCCSFDTKLNVSKTFIVSIIIIYHGFTTSFERLLSWFCCFISKLFD